MRRLKDSCHLLDLRHEPFLHSDVPEGAIRLVERGSQNGIVTVDVTCVPLYHSTNKLLTAVTKTNLESATQSGRRAVISKSPGGKQCLTTAPITLKLPAPDAPDGQSA